MMKLFIKNMVCPRCIMAVEAILVKQGLSAKHILLGEVELQASSLEEPLYSILSKELSAIGFELIDDKRVVMAAQIKAIIIELVHHENDLLKTNLSTYLSNKLGFDYNILSNTFSGATGLTIEKFHIQQKIEKAKELMSYGELTLSEIANRLNYSSVAHLSAQFKKETSLTPSAFKQNLVRKPLDQI